MTTSCIYEGEYHDENGQVQDADHSLGGVAKGHDAVDVPEIIGQEAPRNQAVAAAIEQATYPADGLPQGQTGSYQVRQMPKGRLIPEAIAEQAHDAR